MQQYIHSLHVNIPKVQFHSIQMSIHIYNKPVLALVQVCRNYIKVRGIHTHFFASEFELFFTAKHPQDKHIF